MEELCDKIPLIVVAGATASGKTTLAIELAQRFDGEIVSADSMQIYKYMDIGTAKPTAEERAAAVHHMIDFVDPKDGYSAAEYTAAAHDVIADIAKRGRIPIMCGGTGLYINSVVDDVVFGETESDGELRRELREYAEKNGNESLWNMLREVDPVSAQKIHPNNVKRVIRAIEFYRTSGIPISRHAELAKERESRYKPCMMMIFHDRAKLYDRINKRVELMLDAGLEAEVMRLKNMGCTADMQSMQGIGYKEMLEYLDGKCEIAEAADRIKQGSRNYAKRQLTWFCRDKRIERIPADTEIFSRAAELIQAQLDL